MRNYILSTSWNSRAHTSGIEMVRQIMSMGFTTIELDFALTAQMVGDVLSLVEDGAIEVSSLHNMCPLPANIAVEKASPDHHSLASLDERERKAAVVIAKNTIGYASRLGARAAVFHAGRVEMVDRTRLLATYKNDPKKFEALKVEMIRERAQKKGPHLAQVVASFNELAGYASDMHVKIALENRYYHREMPDSEELEEIYARVHTGELFYWHDVGHAEVFERLSFCAHKDLLDTFGRRLIGMHLHDIIGPIDDHKVPGEGSFDFGFLKPYITDKVMTVLEVHQPASADDITRGVAYLRRTIDE